MRGGTAAISATRATPATSAGRRDRARVTVERASPSSAPVRRTRRDELAADQGEARRAPAIGALCARVGGAPRRQMMVTGPSAVTPPQRGLTSRQAGSSLERLNS
jgi:hypothetical protein